MKEHWLLAIAPGPKKSGHIIMEDGLIVDHGHLPNDELLEIVEGFHGLLAIEMPESCGMAAAVDVLETCVWIGRFTQAAEYADVRRVSRKDVGHHLCNDTNANDSDAHQALIDLYGGKDVVIGKKGSPGPFYGISRRIWNAIAVAETASTMSCMVDG